MEAIVIGAGIGGIATAIRLSQKGYKVIVYEANHYPGGKLSAFNKGKYRFDAGPSLFTLPHLVDELFQLCGEEPEDHFTYKKKEVACEYFWPDGTRLTAWSNPRHFAAEVEDKLGERSETTLRYLEEVRELYERTRSLFLENSLHKIQSYISKDVLKALGYVHKLHLMESMHEVAAKRFSSEKMVQLLDRFATYNGSSPYKAPGVLTMIPHLEHNVGTFVPKNGMHDITTALYELAKRQGVAFAFESTVEEILVKNGMAYGIALESKIEHYADIVVSNMDVVPTYRRLLKNQRAPEKTLRQERSSSALIFYWGIKQKFPQLNLHNIFFSSDYKREFEEIFDLRTPPTDPTIYVNITSKDVPNDAPEYGENWFVMVNVPADYDQDWDAVIPVVRKKILDTLSKALNADIESLIEEEAMLTPSEIERRTSSFRGALYGASSNDTLSAFLRHPNFSRRIAQLYFVGGSVHPGGGIPLCLLSAKIVGNLVPSEL